MAGDWGWAAVTAKLSNQLPANIEALIVRKRSSKSEQNGGGQEAFDQPGDPGPTPPPEFNSRAPRDSNHSWEEPDPSLLDDRRGELPEFPIEALPSNCRGWLERAAHGAGVTPAHVAAPLLTVASSLIGTARRVRAASSWSEPMTTWTALVGFSGSGKTPGIDVMKNALGVIVKNRGRAIDELRREHETAVEAAKAAGKQWKDEVKAALENGAKLPVKPAAADDPGDFIAPQLYVSDATIEKLGPLLTVRPQGMLLLSDELAGLFSNMSRYSRGQDNEFWLECWNGKHHVVERINRPSLRIPHLLIGITGGMQPDKLAESFAGAADGMYARFLFSWPSEAPYRALTDLIMEVEPEILNALDKLARLGGDKPQDFAPAHVPLSRAARAEFEKFREWVFQGKDLVHGRERDWWSKMPGHALRLSGTLAFLDWSMSDCPGAEPKEIGEEFVQNAALLLNGYFHPHSRAALRQIGLSQHDADARRVLQWLKASRRDEVSREDVRRDILAQRLDADETTALLGRMTKAGWLRQRTTVRGPKGGRPSVRWEVNPHLFQA
jgi:hypothetical protein